MPEGRGGDRSSRRCRSPHGDKSRQRPDARGSVGGRGWQRLPRARRDRARQDWLAQGRYLPCSESLPRTYQSYRRCPAGPARCMPVLARMAGGVLYSVFARNSFRVNGLRRITRWAATASTPICSEPTTLSNSPIVRDALDNGLRILTEPMTQVRSVSVGVWLTRGSRHESAERGGIAHLVEHMLFKGTSSRS